ncbi:MAG: YdbC family protein [Clostridia bacterium]
MAEIKFEIVKHIGVLSEGNNGWKKELNLVSWNDRAPKYDIRDWDENHEKMGKGITLSEDEIQNLINLMNNN